MNFNNFAKSILVYCWYVKIPKCRFIEHGSNILSMMLKNTICYNPPLVRDKQLGALTYCETRLLTTGHHCFIRHQTDDRPLPEPMITKLTAVPPQCMTWTNDDWLPIVNWAPKSSEIKALWNINHGKTFCFPKMLFKCSLQNSGHRVWASRR